MARLYALLMVTLVALSACASPVDTPSTVTVELDAFSGLPNPRWTLTASEARELGRLFGDLPEAGGITLPQPVLGYRGFRITSSEGGAVPREAYVTSGLVMVEDQGTLYRDTRGIEAWLIARAADRGHRVQVEVR